MNRIGMHAAGVKATAVVSSANASDSYARSRNLAVLASLTFGVVLHLGTALIINALGPRVIRSYWASGQAASQGFDPFAELSESWAVSFGGAIHFVDPNLNPPTLLPLFQLLALMPMQTAAIVWTLISAGLFYVPALLLIRRYKPHPAVVPWLLLSPLFADTIVLGQVYTLLFALGASAWLLLDKQRDLTAGVCIGVLCAFKPNFGVWPLFLLISGRWQPAISAGVTGVALIILSLMLYGTKSYEQWLAAVQKDAHYIFPTDASINGALERFGIASGELVGALLLVALAVWCWRTKPANPSAPALAVGILSSPLAWGHYALLMFPAFIAGEWTVLTVASAVLLSIHPETLSSAVLAPSYSAVLGLIYTLAVALALSSWLGKAR